MDWPSVMSGESRRLFELFAQEAVGGPLSEFSMGIPSAPPGGRSVVCRSKRPVPEARLSDGRLRAAPSAERRASLPVHQALPGLRTHRKAANLITRSGLSRRLSIVSRGVNNLVTRYQQSRYRGFRGGSPYSQPLEKGTLPRTKFRETLPTPFVLLHTPPPFAQLKREAKERTSVQGKT